MDLDRRDGVSHAGASRSLAWAIATIGPLVAITPDLDPDERERRARLNREREEASAVARLAMQRHQPHTCDAFQEDAIQKVLMGLAADGPRGRQPGDPEDDAGAMAWLLKCRLRKELSEHRRITSARGVAERLAGRLQSLGLDFVAPSSVASDAAALEQFQAALCWIETDLLRRVCTHHRRAAPTVIHRSFRDLLDWAAGEVTVEDIASQRGSTSAAVGKDLNRMRSRLVEALKEVSSGPESGTVPHLAADIIYALRKYT